MLTLAVCALAASQLGAATPLLDPSTDAMGELYMIFDAGGYCKEDAKNLAEIAVASVAGVELPEIGRPCLDKGFGYEEGDKKPLDPKSEPVDLLAGAFEKSGWSKDEARIHAVDCLAVAIRAYDDREAPKGGDPAPEGVVICADGLYCLTYWVKIQWCEEGEPRFSRRWIAKNCWEGIKENCAADNPISCSGSEKEVITFPSSTCLGIDGCFQVSELESSVQTVCCNGSSNIVYCSCFPDELCEGGEWPVQCCDPQKDCECCEE